MDIDWKKIVFDPMRIKQLEVLAQRRFNDGGLAEEATTFLIEQLSNDDWRRLKIFSGDAKPETFLYSIAINLLEEFSRRRFGRLRPPEWLKREGGLWIRIWKMLCLERQTRDRVLDLCCAQTRRDPDFVLSVIKTIRARLPSCGVQNISVSLDRDHTEDVPLEIATAVTLEESLAKAELEERLALFAELLENLHRPSNSLAETKARLNAGFDMEELHKLRRNLNCSEEEILVLRMAFQEGLRLNVIATALGMPSYQPGRILKRVFKSMLTALQSSGIATDRLHSLLAEVEF